MLTRRSRQRLGRFVKQHETKNGFIPEIQGLRTIALLLVAIFHIWFGRVSGGVDIFLLVSAYLLTRSMLAKAERDQAIAPFRFLARKFARLMPAATVTIVAVLICSLLVIPLASGAALVGDAIGSLFYVENFHLQRQSANYFDADQSLASPFQHFWSLSIQGQVFIAWALIHAGLTALASRINRSARTLALWMFGAITIASFVYSVWLTGANQPYAYFDTTARLWEFGVGSLLAVVQPWIRLSRTASSIASWVGLIAAVSCGFVEPVSSNFPGAAALWPTAAATLIILSSGNNTAWGADRVLSSAILRKLGGYTYALYLTHWPVLVLFKVATGVAHPNVWQGCAVLAISAVAAVVLVHGVERPIARFTSASNNNPPSTKSAEVEQQDQLRIPSKRRARSTRPVLRQITTVTACVALGAATAYGGVQWRQQQLIAMAEELNNLDSSSLGANADQFTDIPLQMDWETAKSDWSKPGYVCAKDDPYISALCYEIAPNPGPGETPREIFVVGSSHMTQFTAVLKETVGRHQNFGLRTQVAPGCYFHIREKMGDACSKAWDAGTEYISDKKPDVVIIHTTVQSEPTGPEHYMDDVLDWIRSVKEVSPETIVIALRDNGRLEEDPATCVAQHGEDSSACTSPTNSEPDQDYVNKVRSAGAVWVDLRPWQCPDGTCRPVLGGLPVFLDTHHITASFSRTLAQKFADSVSDEIPWWPREAYAGTYEERADIRSDSSEDLNDAGS